MRRFDSGATAEHVPIERVPGPVYDTTDFVVAAPQEVARQAQPSPLVRFLPIVTAIATVGAMAVAYYSRSAVARNPAFLIFPLMMLVSTVTTVVSNADRGRGAINTERADYLGYLSDVRAERRQYSCGTVSVAVLVPSGSRLAMDSGGWLPDVGAASFGPRLLSGANRTRNSAAWQAVSPADLGDY